jgi:hypothetical protein
MSPADCVRSFISSATRTVRFLAPVALLALLAPAPRAAVLPPPLVTAPQTVSPEASDEVASVEVASVRRDVRLRKLHLVRPDLIQYPLSVDVFC